MQRHSRRQGGSQAFQLLGPLPPQAEGVEELVYDKLSMIWRMEATHFLKCLGQFRFRLLRLGGWMMRTP